MGLSQRVHPELIPKIQELTWDRRFGHLGSRYLHKLIQENLVDGFDYDASKGNSIGFCEQCAEGKHHRSRFPTNGRSTRFKEPLGLVHSDVCGKMNTQSLGGSEYFLTFIDDHTHYVWIYVLKCKDLEWNALVEKSTGRKLKAIRTDIGGEFTSREFASFRKSSTQTHCAKEPRAEQSGRDNEPHTC